MQSYCGTSKEAFLNSKGSRLYMRGLSHKYRSSLIHSAHISRKSAFFGILLLTHNVPKVKLTNESYVKRNKKSWIFLLCIPSKF